ncbi:MAG: ribonuclease III [Chloroflexi bacterium CG_4_8_14_3_um_filter_45_15]|nr:MAG: ribonuclease III [Chloroflexi bacterium CG_4_8_14_3_um_filter_45_15]
MQNWEDCEKSLGVSFANKSLLKQALTHSSYINENPDFVLLGNERLEFLGDAILDFIVAEKLYKEFPELPEGKLTAIRASLVCRDALTEVASSLGLGDYLLLGRGEEASKGRTKPSNLANAMEAVIGAIYLDQGLVKAKKFVLSRLRPRLRKIKAGKITLNYKALLQEFVQRKKTLTPVYRLVEITGPGHEKQFTAEVMVEGEVLGKGTGKNKKSAEMEAAHSAWEELWRKESLPTPTLI